MTTPKTGRPTDSKSQNFGQNQGNKDVGQGQSVTAKAEHLIRDAATVLSEKAENVACTFSDKADEAVAATGRGIESVAGQIRSYSSDSGMVGNATNKIADSLEYGGMYLREQGASGLTTDVTKLVRSNPITSLMVGVGVGFLLARATTCRNS
ncbi:MAG: hypothetical protein IAG10_09285 [Planctomycetaceae bacterium]|nr:hypothetical protein [Planctomycetaceae bacterium]